MNKRNQINELFAELVKGSIGDMSQTELAQKAGLVQTTISHVLSGKDTDGSLDTWVRIFDALGVRFQTRSEYGVYSAREGYAYNGGNSSAEEAERAKVDDEDRVMVYFTLSFIGPVVPHQG